MQPVLGLGHGGSGWAWAGTWPATWRWRLTTAPAAAAVTTVAERHTRAWRAGGGSYFGTYAAMFLVKFVLLDRVVFRSRHQW